MRRILMLPRVPFFALFILALIALIIGLCPVITLSGEQQRPWVSIGNGYVIPPEFVDGDISEVTTREMARANMLTAWGCVLAGNKPPEKFGEAMAALAMKYDLPCTAEELMKTKE